MEYSERTYNWQWISQVITYVIVITLTREKIVCYITDAGKE